MLEDEQVCSLSARKCSKCALALTVCVWLTHAQMKNFSLILWAGLIFSSPLKVNQPKDNETSHLREGCTRSCDMEGLLPEHCMTLACVGKYIWQISMLKSAHSHFNLKRLWGSPIFPTPHAQEKGLPWSRKACNYVYPTQTQCIVTCVETCQTFALWTNPMCFIDSTRRQVILSLDRVQLYLVSECRL